MAQNKAIGDKKPQYQQDAEVALNNLKQYSPLLYEGFLWRRCPEIEFFGWVVLQKVCFRENMMIKILLTLFVNVPYKLLNF